MQFQFDAHQQYQQDAISAVVDLFDGQPEDANQLISGLHEQRDYGSQGMLDMSWEIGAQGNNLVLDDDTILANLQKVQDRNGLDINTQLIDGKQFDIEMETGTGKTYVYLRTAYELSQHYHFNKFIILVPSVAIREGVKSSIESMKAHFKELYPGVNINDTVYAGSQAPNLVRNFTTATTLQIMILTIDSLRGKKDTLIMNQYRDSLDGHRPIDYLSATRPIVIMDEPQNMESELSKVALQDLNPMCVLRYSATHRTHRNTVYRLDPLDAHQLGLVKTIVVSSAEEMGSSAKPYIKLVEVQRSPKFAVKLELVCKKKDGTYARRVVKAHQNDNLERLSGDNSAYANNLRISGISVEPEMVEITNCGVLHVGEEIGSNKESVVRAMIQETISEHMRKESQLHHLGIKVLSLFFIDKVASYLGTGHNNLDANGEFVQMFDDIYTHELAKWFTNGSFMPSNAQDARSGYFAQMKGKGKGATMTFKDSSGKTKADDDAYELIMKDKARLLSMDEPVRFIFSHSALREGWDNPNVFQICTLREMSTETERRQTIGRGLRLPLNQQGERIRDKGINQLTVIANESYESFASALQHEYQQAGVRIGTVSQTAFASIPLLDNEQEANLGTTRSRQIWQHLHEQGFINKIGEVLGMWRPQESGFSLHLPDEFTAYETAIINIVSSCRIESVVKSKKARVHRKFNGNLYLSPEFEEFWEKITKRTTYRVEYDSDQLITKCVKRIRATPEIPPIHIAITRAGVELTRGGAQTSVMARRESEIVGAQPLPDILTRLQEATSLTRKTIAEILRRSDRLSEFIHNPNDFIKMVTTCIKEELAQVIVEGIQYEEIGGSIYELRQLMEDGQAEKDRFEDQVIKIEHTNKTDFDYVVFDSAIEEQFARELDSREDIKVFMKLPDKYRIPTPVGDYNPDWAIIKQEHGQDKLYLIRETKSTRDEYKRRPTENAKIKAAMKHYQVIDVDYAVAAPGAWGV